MASLNIKCSFSVTVNGKVIEGWHGTDSANDADDAFAITVDGNGIYQPNQLATGSGRTIYDDDNQFPTSWDYLFICSTQDLDLQIIAATLNVTIPIKAGVPFILGYKTILAAIAVTVQTGGATPAYETIDSINISNRSGSTANYVFFCMD